MTADTTSALGARSSRKPAATRSRRRRLWTIAAIAIAVTAWIVVMGQVVALGPTVIDRLQLALGVGFPERLGQPMLVIAHRGDLDGFPENTLEAIEAAAGGPADGIEMDIHRSADGVWYVIHDATLDRTTDLHGAVSETSSSRIDTARIDGGLGYRAEHLGLGVPRLAAVLDALNDYEGLLLLDIKHAETGDAGEVAELLEGRQATVLVRSPEDVEAIVSVDPEAETVAYPQIASDEVDGHLMEAAYVATVERVQGSDLPVWTYVDESQFGTDEADFIRRAWAAGVYAYLSKHPEQAAATVADLAARD